MIERLWRERSVVWLSGVRRVGKSLLCRSLPDVESGQPWLIPYPSNGMLADGRIAQIAVSVSSAGAGVTETVQVTFVAVPSNARPLGQTRRGSGICPSVERLRQVCCRYPASPGLALWTHIE